MTTLRQALRTLDVDLIAETYMKWLRKPSTANIIARAEEVVEQTRTGMEMDFHALGAYDFAERAAVRRAEAEISRLSPEVIYHLWRTQRAKTQRVGGQRQFPIPFNRARDHMFLMWLLIDQVKAGVGNRWSFEASWMEGCSDEVATFLLSNLDFLPKAELFPACGLGSHRMLQMKHVEKLLQMNERSLGFIARNQHMDEVMLRWLLDRFEEAPSREILYRLAQNQSPAVTTKVCDLLWKLHRQYDTVLPKDRSGLFTVYLSEHPNVSDALFLKIAKTGKLQRIPRGRATVSRATVDILLKNDHAANRLRTLSHPATGGYLVDIVESSPDVNVELLVGAGANPTADVSLLERLSSMSQAKIRAAVAKNPALSAKIGERLAYDRAANVRKAVAKNKNLPGSVRFLANPTEEQAKLALKEDRERFLDWMDETFPDLTGLPDNFLLMTLPAVVVGYVAPLRIQPNQKATELITT